MRVALQLVGMIAKATTTIPTTSFVQTFKYDSLNRLTEAKETTGGNQNWKQTFDYDRYGNRTDFSQITGVTQLTLTSVNHPEIDPANNRFTTGQGYVYDFNGNIIQDAEGRSFTFNGDDKQVEIRNANNEVIGQYFYDGSGARVKKVVPSTGETTVFVYDAGGALAAEYEIIDQQTPRPPAPATSYLTTDHLGSPRVVTDENGDVVSRRDFMPFGEEIYVGVGDRTTNLKYSLSTVDHVRQRFTGYEKDSESGLDFAQARMYQNKHGRFTAPDPLMASANPANPQTFNRYIYTSNNPVNYIDPSGLDWCGVSSGNANGYSDISWQNGSCGSNWVTINTNKIINCTYECTLNGQSYAAGSSVVLLDQGRSELHMPSAPGQQAAAQGQANAQTTNNVAGSNATDIAADAIVTLPTASGPSGVLSLCPSVTLCGNNLTVETHVTRLMSGQGASAKDLLNATQIALTGIGMTDVPVVSQLAELGNMGLDAMQGDWVAVGIGAGTLIPVVGAGASIALQTHRARRLANVVPSSGSMNAAEMANDLHSQVGKNTVSANTINKEIHVDLKGRAHTDKATGVKYPTPHTQTRPLHRANGKVNASEKGATIRGATKADIRMARNIWKRRK